MDIKSALRGAWAAVPALAADRVTKIWAMAAKPRFEVLPGIFGVRYAQNTGAAFSMFSSSPWLVNVISIVLVIAITAFLVTDKKLDRWTRLGLWLVAAGGLGNIYDRLAYGYVVDMIEVLFMDFAIFNVADICVCCGAFLAAAAIIISDKKQKKTTEGV